jgi:glyoxylase-like metal-dependent hydrolase (beta-lactamase superfamily II)
LNAKAHEDGAEVFDLRVRDDVHHISNFRRSDARHTILVDTCTGKGKGHPPPFDFPGKERWRNELFALGVGHEKIDYVFCTQFHIDHTGWNATLRDGTLGAYVPECKVRIPQKGYMRLGKRSTHGRQSSWHGIP